MAMDGVVFDVPDTAANDDAAHTAALLLARAACGPAYLSGLGLKRNGSPVEVSSLLLVYVDACRALGERPA